MDKYRFHPRFMQAVIALGCVAIGVSLYYWQMTQPVTPVLVLALAAMTASSVFHVPVPGGLGRVSLLAPFFLLALLLLGGEAAILFAAVASAGLSLRRGP